MQEGQAGSFVEPIVVDYGLRDPARPKLGQWVRWRTPKDRLVITSTSATEPVENWYAHARSYVIENFPDDF